MQTDQPFSAKYFADSDHNFTKFLTGTKNTFTKLRNFFDNFRSARLAVRNFGLLRILWIRDLVEQVILLLLPDTAATINQAYYSDFAGIETTESMLLTGTTLTCFGRLDQIPYTSTAPHWLPGTVKFQYKLSPPSSDHT